jgi:hypothetical protein
MKKLILARVLFGTEIPGKVFSHIAFSRKSVRLTGGLVLVISSPVVSGSAGAGLTQTTIFFSSQYQQTSPISVTPVNGGTNDFFAALAVVNNFNDFDVNGITVTVPTSPPTTDILATPATIVLEGGTSSPSYGFQTGFLTPAQLAAQFPTGTYVVAANNTSTNAHVAVSLNYTGNHFANVPTLTAGTYGALNGLDPNQPFTFNFAQFTPDAAINEAFEFLTITDEATNMVAFSESFLSNTVTVVTVPSDTLLPNTAYSEELIFSARIAETDPAMIPCIAIGTTCPGLTELAFDTRTVTNFMTGTAAVVPEPSSLVLLLSSSILAGLSLIRRKLRR